MDGAGVGGPRRDLSDAALLAACSARVDASFANLAARSAILAARAAGSSSSSALGAGGGGGDCRRRRCCCCCCSCCSRCSRCSRCCREGWEGAGGGASRRCVSRVGASPRPLLPLPSMRASSASSADHSSKGASGRSARSSPPSFVRAPPPPPPPPPPRRRRPRLPALPALPLQPRHLLVEEAPVVAAHGAPRALRLNTRTNPQASTGCRAHVVPTSTLYLMAEVSLGATNGDGARGRGVVVRRRRGRRHEAQSDLARGIQPQARRRHQAKGRLRDRNRVGLPHVTVAGVRTDAPRPGASAGGGGAQGMRRRRDPTVRVASRAGDRAGAR